MKARVLPMIPNKEMSDVTVYGMKLISTSEVIVLSLYPVRVYPVRLKYLRIYYILGLKIILTIILIKNVISLSTVQFPKLSIY